MSFSPLMLVLTYNVDDQRFRNCETGKPTGAADLALDKMSSSKYSYNLGGVVQRRGKVTKKWRRKTMGQVPLG